MPPLLPFPLSSRMIAIGLIILILSTMAVMLTWLFMVDEEVSPRDESESRTDDR